MKSQGQKSKAKKSIKTFEDLEVWQLSKKLTINIYKATNDLSDYSYSDQIRRASVSIMNNISEGFERQSDKQFSHYLIIAKGSAGEVRSMITLGKELGYFSEEASTNFIEDCITISRKLSGLIKYLRKDKDI